MQKKKMMRFSYRLLLPTFYSPVPLVKLGFVGAFDMPLC